VVQLRDHVAELGLLAADAGQVWKVGEILNNRNCKY
jgi:hypothetical protein